MSRPITISLSPNVESDDVQRAFYARTHKSIWQDNQWTLKAERLLEQTFAHAALTSSGRQAIFRVLKALGVGPGDEVIIQAFTCIAVPAPIIWAGAKPVYADIKSDTYNLDPEDVRRKIKPTTKAIIVQHTFGIPGPMPELKQVAADHNLALIEDMAHGLHPLQGDAAILSFGRDKLISSVFGGAVVSYNQHLVERIREQQRALPFPPDSWVRQQLMHSYLIDIILPWYFRAGLGKAWLVLLQKLKQLSKAVAAAEKTGQQPDHINYRYSPALAYLLINQLDKLDRFQTRRREIVATYNQVFNANVPAQLRYPLQRKNAKQLLLKARSRHMLLGDWYQTPLVPGDCDISKFSYVPGSCPVAEEVGSKIINLPTYPLMTDEQVDQVIAFIQAND